MIHELTTRTVERIPELRFGPEWQPGEPWRLQRDERTGRGTHWWRICSGGTIYRVEVKDGEARRF